LVRVGVEGTGAYGAALSRFLRSEGVEVVEVDRPDRKTRRAKGKSDPVDAYAAALAALSGRAAGIPKSRDGKVEAIRALRVARRSAVKARTQAVNQLRALLLTGPAELREQLRGLTAGTLIDTCAYLARRRQEGLTKPEAIRCLKRYIAREVYRKLINAPHNTKDKPAAA
jgi:transposase